MDDDGVDFFQLEVFLGDSEEESIPVGLDFLVVDEELVDGFSLVLEEQVVVEVLELHFSLEEAFVVGS